MQDNHRVLTDFGTKPALVVDFAPESPGRVSPCEPHLGGLAWRTRSWGIEFVDAWACRVL